MKRDTLRDWDDCVLFASSVVVEAEILPEVARFGTTLDAVDASLASDNGRYDDFLAFDEGSVLLLAVT